MVTEKTIDCEGCDGKGLMVVNDEGRGNVMKTINLKVTTRKMGLDNHEFEVIDGCPFLSYYGCGATGEEFCDETDCPLREEDIVVHLAIANEKN